MIDPNNPGVLRDLIRMNTTACAEAAWESLEGFSEVRYVHEDANSPYKPFYRLATILVHIAPPHFKLWGIRRHLTEDDAVEIVRQAHPWLAEWIDNGERGRERFITLVNYMKTM